jgi:hypoxanthine-DNA glycosylase
MKSTVTHPFPALYDQHSRVLILGSFPSVKSREQQFFYGHPQNRFWRVLSAVCGESVPVTVEEKTALLLKRHIALWDVIASCRIEGSSDATIKDVVPNDLSPILKGADIRKIYCNGTKSYELYRKYVEPETGRKAEKLPSTSPANAAVSLEQLIRRWGVISETDGN